MARTGAQTGSPDGHRGLAGMVKPSRLARKKSIIEKIHY
jgi:hypothetical protein